MTSAKNHPVKTGEKNLQAGKERKKRDRYLNLAKELKKLWNIKGIVIRIVIGALSSITIGRV